MSSRTTPPPLNSSSPLSYKIRATLKSAGRLAHNGRSDHAVALLHERLNDKTLEADPATALALHRALAYLHEERREFADALRHGRMIAQLQEEVERIERRALLHAIEQKE